MAPPTPSNVTFFPTSAQLREWFMANHNTAPELWVGFYKKRTGRPSITWQELVDQELCFGWIDSVRYTLDDERSAQRVTPRRKGSIWSAINIRRFKELERLGLAHPAGRAAFEKRDEARSRIYSYENWLQHMDGQSEAEFRRHGEAWKFFEAQAASYRRTAAYWIASAKREETRARRLKVLIEHSEKGERVPQFVSPSRRRPAP